MLQENGDEAVFQVQLTRYACGGLVIGTACNHQVSDGQSMCACGDRVSVPAR